MKLMNGDGELQCQSNICINKIIVRVVEISLVNVREVDITDTFLSRFNVF